MLDDSTDDNDQHPSPSFYRRKIGGGQHPKRRARSTEGIDITANN